MNYKQLLDLIADKIHIFIERFLHVIQMIKLKQYRNIKMYII